MLIGGIVAVVVVVGVVAGGALRRRSHDDVHSVEHYHRQLHTLEEMRAHPPAAREDGNGEASFPASAFRVSSSSTVRLTEPDGTVVPPAPPPPVPNPGEPVTFDDAPRAEADGRAGSVPGTFMTGIDDPAMHSINQRPRRLGGTLAAIAAVVVLVVILVVTGLHSNTPAHRGGHSTSTTVAHSHAVTHAGSHTHHTTPTTTTTAPPVPTVSPPANASPYAATYQVADASYSLALAARTGECWVSATDTSTGKVLFTGTLVSGQTQTVAATGPVTVVAGAPNAFAATVNGAPVILPTGALAPFTLTFETPGGTGGGTSASSGAAGNTGNSGTTSG